MSEPFQLPNKQKYMVGRKFGYKSKHNQNGHSTRRKTGAKQVHDPIVPVLIDGKRVSRMRYSAWQAMSH